jgi:hypothetical protein
MNRIDNKTNGEGIIFFVYNGTRVCKIRTTVILGYIVIFTKRINSKRGIRIEIELLAKL